MCLRTFPVLGAEPRSSRVCLTGGGFRLAQGVGNGGRDSFNRAQGVLVERVSAMSMVGRELG